MPNPPTAVLPRPWMKRTSGGVRVELPARHASYAPVLLGAWLLVWGLGVTVVLLGWAGVLVAPLPYTPINMVYLGLLVAGGAFVAWRLAWLLRGRERVALKNGVLEISRGVKGGHVQRYPWSEIRDLHVGSYRRRVIYPSWGRRFVDKGEACLRFTYEGREEEFARGLSREEADDLLALLRRASI
ncbi:MAG TPA: hypothetical protein VEJ18_14805 [Planctomycetota bacterium]|nr:hypothetical protein [Planctomycetota bacterium]